MENETKDVEVRQYINAWVYYNKQLHDKHTNYITAIIYAGLILIILTALLAAHQIKMGYRVNDLETEIQVLKEQGK